MADFISDNLTAIIIALIGLLAAGVLIKIVINSKRTDKSTHVNQSKSRVHGDQAGGNIHKR